MFKEDLFYNPKKPADHQNLREIEEVTDVYEIPWLQQQNVEEWSDTDSEFDAMNIHSMEDTQEEESSCDQEQTLQDYTRRNYDNDDFLPGAFSDNAEPMTRGLKPLLPTPDITPEPSNRPSIPDLPKASKP